MTPIAFAEIWNAILTALPGMGLALVLVLIGWLIGRLLFTLTWRLLQRLKFDEAASRAGIAAGLKQAGFDYTPSKLIAALVHWAAFLTFGMLALDALGFDAILQPLQSLIGYLPRLLAAGVALVAGLFLAQILRTRCTGRSCKLRHRLPRSRRKTCARPGHHRHCPGGTRTTRPQYQHLERCLC